MLNKVITIMKKQLNYDGKMDGDTGLLSDLNINSLDMVELICVFEEEFDIEIPEKDLRRFSVINDVVNYLQERA